MKEDAPVLVVEDDSSIADLLDTYLRNEGFRVLIAGDAERALEIARRQTPMIVLLDINLPGEMNGLDLCRALRSTMDVPIVMVTARDTEIDRVLGLEIGADDYVTKPFSPRELTARIKAILRRFNRGPQDLEEVLSIGVISVDMKRHEVTKDGIPVPLTTREFDLLAHLLRNSGAVLTRSQLLEGVWGPEWYGDDRTVDVHVRQLRKKLGEELDLNTVWGTGYRLG